MHDLICMFKNILTGMWGMGCGKQKVNQGRALLVVQARDASGLVKDGGGSV